MWYQALCRLVMDREDERGGTCLKKNVGRKTQTAKKNVAEDFTLKLWGRGCTFGEEGEEQEEEEAGAGIFALRSKTEEEEKEEEEGEAESQ